MKLLTLQPLIPPPLWILVSLGCGAIWVWYGCRRPGDVSRRRWSGILTLMACGIVLVLIILLNPTWLERATPPGGKPLLTVLVDTSASMATPDANAAAATTRFDAAQELARGFAGALRNQFEIQTVAFAGSTKVVDPEALPRFRPDGPTTDLAAAIADSLAEGRQEGQAIVLLSDGIHNAGGQAARVLEAARLARGLDAPIYTKTFGGEVEVRDLALDLESQQELAFIGQKAPLAARVRRRGLGASQATVVLTSQDRELARKQVAFDAEGRALARFDVQQLRPGLYRYQTRVEPAPGEVILVNNAETFLLQVVDEPIRVLLLEGKPYWDAKFLMRTLTSDPSIELDSVVRLAEGRFLRRTLSRPKPKQGTTVPARAGAQAAASAADVDTARVDDWRILQGPAEILTGPTAELQRYQIVVLGRDADVFLGDATMGRLRAWIAKEGGALVCYRGAPVAQLSQPLARLLPVRWARSRESRFRVQLTERGHELRWLPSSGKSPQDEVLARLPTLARNEQPQEPKPLAVVLATSTPAAGAAPTPVVTYQPYGSGRVVVIEGAGMWRWAFLPPQYRDQGEVYGGLWHSMIRWLASGSGLPPGQDMALRADKIGFGTNEPVTATLLMRQEVARRDVPKVDLDGDLPDGSKSFTPVASGDEPGTFRILFGTLREGRYRARIAGRTASTAEIAFDVRGFAEEQLDRAARPDLMARIARESGGAVLTVATPGELVTQFQAERARSRTERVLRDPAWDRWWVLAGIVLIWGTAWKLRRSAGLV
ncbi:MAG: hypothetical protein ACHRXM_12870 [Isosphaerales bacterium]